MEGDARQIMQKYAGEKAVKGTRCILHDPAQPRGLCLQPKFMDNVKTVGEMGFGFDACIRWTEIEDLYQLALHCPQTQIIIDHTGMVDMTVADWTDPAMQEKIAAWKAVMGKLAALPNIYIKISGLPSSKLEEIGEAVGFVMDLFGEDRCMYASNFPVCGIDGVKLNDWAFAMLDLTSGWEQARKDKFFYKNAQRIYQLQ